MLTDSTLPPLPRPQDPRDERWLDLLLCPARTAIVITAVDVARIGRELSVELPLLAPRAGVQALMARHPAGTLRRLAHVAETQADAYTRAPARREARWWAERARHTAELLREQAALLGTHLLLVADHGGLRPPRASCSG